jgi:BASS family bile acid:Na+ symporter
VTDPPAVIFTLALAVVLVKAQMAPSGGPPEIAQFVPRVRSALLRLCCSPTVQGRPSIARGKGDMHGWILDAIRTVAHIAIPLVALAAGLSAVSFKPSDVWREPSLLLRSLLAVLVVVPLVALVLVKLLPVTPEVRGGLLTIAVAIGPVMALKRAKAGGGDESFALGLDLSLLLLSIPFVPAAAAALGAMFGRDVSVGVWAVARVVLPLQLLPLLLGVVVAQLWPRMAARFIEPVTVAGNVLLAALAAVLVVALAKRMLGIGAPGLLATLLLAVTSVAVGHLLGGPRPRTRFALAAFSALRFPALALLLATKLPGGARFVPAIFAYLIVSAVVLALYGAAGRFLAKRKGSAEEPRPIAPAPAAA